MALVDFLWNKKKIIYRNNWCVCVSCRIIIHAHFEGHGLKVKSI